MNKISILMSVYKKDNPEYLTEAFESLKNQTEFFYELVLVKDGTLSIQLDRIVDKYKKVIKIKPIIIPKNIGLPKALNIGLKKVQTDWVARFDSDDICHNNRFKSLNEIIEIYGDEIDIFGTYMKEFENNFKDDQKIRFVPLDEKGIKNKLLISNPMNHISVVFKRRLVESFSDKNGVFYPLIPGFEDYALWIKLIKNGVKFRNFPLITVYARVGEGMLKRRGGIKYILNEIRFRKFTFKYFNLFENILIFFISFTRIIIFSLPTKLKRIFYKIKRKLI